MAKRWIAHWFFIVSIIPIVGLVNFTVDPYQHYRKASWYPILYEHARELNAGIARNFHFDSAVFGTSMMENFELGYLHKTLGFHQPVKLTMPGSSAYEQRVALESALRHQKLKNVLIGIDFFSYYGDINRLKYGESFFPFYLYDENPFNDLRYLISIDTLKQSFAAIYRIFSIPKEHGCCEMAYMYEWLNKKDSDKTIDALKKRWEKRDEFDNKTADSEKKLHYLKSNFDANLKTLVANHPQISYTILFPPYSVLAYKIFRQRGQMSDFLHFKSYVIEQLAAYKNAAVYDFQFADTITYNLENYYDFYHYKKRINRWMSDEIALGHYKMDVQKEQKLQQQFLRQLDKYRVDLE
jgi:hypothetical protein